jgi:hypothetical protein
MPLEFAVLNDDGRPDRVVPLGVDLHQELMEAARVCGTTGFQVYAEYYEDSETSLEELSTLIDESRLLRRQVLSTELRQFLERLDELISYAIARGRTLYAIAD